MPSRLVVTERLYYNHDEVGSLPISHAFSQPMQKAEQCYMRHLRVASEWTAIEKCWLEECSQIVVINESKVYDLLIGQDVTRENDLVRSVVIVQRVRPGQSTRFRPLDYRELRFRSIDTVCIVPFKVYVIPE